MPELMPCPFCGGPGHATYDDYVHDDLRPMPVVECNACHAWVRAESWNSRAIPADQVLVPRELVARAIALAEDAMGVDFSEHDAIRDELRALLQR